jgi:PhnB protein
VPRGSTGAVSAEPIPAALDSGPGTTMSIVATTELTPMLTVKDAASAVEFYRRAFGARELSRVTSPTGQSVVELTLDGHKLFVVDENPAAFNLSPEAVGGTTVRLNLIVDDPDAAAQRAVDAGAKVIFPVSDQPYGLRQGRIADPAGHHWLLGKPLDRR